MNTPNEKRKTEVLLSNSMYFLSPDKTKIIQVLYLIEKEINNAPEDQRLIKKELYKLLNDNLELRVNNGKARDLEEIQTFLQSFLIKNKSIKKILIEELSKEKELKRDLCLKESHKLYRKNKYRKYCRGHYTTPNRRAYQAPIVLNKRGNAFSWKPHNIIFNQKKALSSLPTIVIESYNLYSAANPILINCLIIFIIMLQLNGLFSVTLIGKESKAICFLAEKKAYSMETAIEMKDFPFTDDEIRTLIDAKCVEIIEDKIYLVDKVYFIALE